MNEVGMLPGLAAASEIEGPEGTAPKTVDPLEFVVFNTDELVLQRIHYFNLLFFNRETHISIINELGCLS